MTKIFTSIGILLLSVHLNAQTNPAITSWLRNTSSITGRHYVSGSSTVVNDATLANVQSVKYSSNYVYVTTNGIPSYVTGPFLDGNPNIAGSQNNVIFKFTLSPSKNTGTLKATTGGNIGVFKNGVALFDYRDGVSYSSSSGKNAGGPLGGSGDGVWNRDAVLAEMKGFDCSKGHPAGTNYHHHQNPNAFNLDKKIVSSVCDLYASDGLYVINENEHSPLLGFAYDGYPIYGAYAYKNIDGTGGITRMKSSYSLRNITTRTTYYDGTDVTDGPQVNTTYPLGTYREDYQYNTTSVATPDYLDEHNGRYCVTPEYPSGTYAYFCTVDENHNSYYPYVVGPTFYGNYLNAKVNSIIESVTTYSPVLGVNEFELENFNFKVYPNPSADFVLIQSNEMINNNLKAELIDEQGRIVSSETFYQGSTICYLETQNLYNGLYFLKLSNINSFKTYKVIIRR